METQPQYLALYQKVREQITAGDFAYGAKLPSKRVLAEREHVSVITVAHAYEILCEEGYVEAREKSGYYVRYRASDGFAVQPHADFARSVSDMPQGTQTFSYSVLAKTVRFVLSEYGGRVMIKTEHAGLPLLREAIAAYLARSRGIHVEAEQIFIGAGAEYLYTMLIRLLGTDRVYGLEDPSYHKIRQIYEGSGVVCRMLKLGTDGILSADLAQTDASVLHITPYRSFPSGVTASVPKRMEYAHFVQMGDRYLIEDDVESEFTLLGKMEDTVFSMDTKERVIYLNTFTKTISPALRIAYAILPKALLPRWRENAGYFSCPVATLEQYLVAELLRRGDFERQINRVRRQKRRLAAEQRSPRE